MQQAVHAQSAPAPEWDAVEPLLNSALSTLKPADREAVLLRFLEGHTLAETGTLLGLSEDAARMRVTRALEKLRRYLTAHGAAVTGLALTGFLTTEAVRPVSAQAASAVTQGTLQALSTAPAPNVLLFSKGVSHTMKLIKIKFAAFAAGFLLVGASVPPLVHALDAQTPSVVSTAGTKTIVLQHIIPTELLKSLHWDQPANLPAGVTKIEALPAQNALAVTASSAGLAKVREIIKPLDIEPRQVKIISAFAHALDADLKASGIKFNQVPANDPSQKKYRFYAAGSHVAQFLQKLTKQEAIVQAPDITTTNNVTAAISINASSSGSGKVIVQQITVTPRINTDNSVTLALHPIFLDETVNREFSATRTVNNNETMMIVIPLTDSQAAGENTLFFVTPTVK